MNKGRLHSRPFLPTRNLRRLYTGAMRIVAPGQPSPFLLLFAIPILPNGRVWTGPVLRITHFIEMRMMVATARRVATAAMMIAVAGVGCTPARPGAMEPRAPRRTTVTIEADRFLINGRPTYEGRTWTTSYGGVYPVEGLLMNARLVQGIFDDLNPRTRGQWGYPDTGRWDPERNTREFIDAMAAWREHGLLSFTLNLQGGCPYGYCRAQPWENTAFRPDGSLRPDFLNRLTRILDRADALGMVPILGYFYFGQDERLLDEAAVKRAVDNATAWVLDQGYRNVIIEINNECSIAAYDHAVLRCDRVHELIERAKNIQRHGHRLYVSTSLAGGAVPPPAIVAASDFVLLHGNGVRNPERMVEMIRQVRQMNGYTPKPIVNNEDDQPWLAAEQGWGERGNNFVASAKNYASWGYFDFRRQEEDGDYNLGFQSMPVNWQITSARKRDFFNLLATITGNPGTPRLEPSWSRTAGGVTMRVEGERADAPIQRVELLVDNVVVGTATHRPFTFQVAVPDANHWVRARAIYWASGREVIIESPYYRNPWWPYGGPGDP